MATGPRMPPISRARAFSGPESGVALGGRLAGGGIDDDHGAVGEMGDAVGDVTEQELLATAHPRTADDDDVGIGPPGGVEDRGGDVLARLDHRAGADPVGRQ